MLVYIEILEVALEMLSHGVIKATRAISQFKVSVLNACRKWEYLLSSIGEVYKKNALEAK